MDTLEVRAVLPIADHELIKIGQNFSPVDTTGFIGIQSIRLKKYGLQIAEEGANGTQSSGLKMYGLQKGEVDANLD